MDAYKYYTKEQYEKFGSILETAQQIDARLKDNKTQNYNNNKLMKSYKNEWKERTFQTKQFKKYWHYRQGQQGFAGPSKDGAFLRNEPEFLDD
jgi:hypothetical protein